MYATRNYLVLTSLAGLGAALWYSRPEDPGELAGWIPSLFFSAAWLINLAIGVVSAQLGRPCIAIGALIALIISEFVVLLNVSDPWFFLFMPLVQLLAVAFGAVLGFPFDRA